MRVGSRVPSLIILVLAQLPWRVAVSRQSWQLGKSNASRRAPTLARLSPLLLVSWRAIPHPLQGHTQSQLIVYKREVPAERGRQSFGDMHAAEPPTAR